MSLWEQYQKEHANDLLIEDVPDSMQDSIRYWLLDVGDYLNNPYQTAIVVKNRFRIVESIPNNYLNNSSRPPDNLKFAHFLLNIARLDSVLFFTILDYLIKTHQLSDKLCNHLGEILDFAGHRYTVIQTDKIFSINERIPIADLEFYSMVLSNKTIYSEEFNDAFQALYGLEPNYTSATGEAFQALESALKLYIGENKGNNLGALLNWLRSNKNKWSYSVPSDGQGDVQEFILASIDFVNKSFRKTKHGQAYKTLKIEKQHAEVILRTVALLINIFDNTIEVETAH